jgi:hypothetical protein
MFRDLCQIRSDRTMMTGKAMPAQIFAVRVMG